MTNENTPRRKPVMRGAMEGGCPSWAPIRPAAHDGPSAKPTTGTDPLTTPDAVTDSDEASSPASDAKR